MQRGPTVSGPWERNVEAAVGHQGPHHSRDVVNGPAAAATVAVAVAVTAATARHNTLDDIVYQMFEWRQRGSRTAAREQPAHHGHVALRRSDRHDLNEEPQRQRLLPVGQR